MVKALFAPLLILAFTDRQNHSCGSNSISFVLEYIQYSLSSWGLYKHSLNEEIFHSVSPIQILKS